MYNPTKWTDRVVDADSGEVIQEGTDQSAANFNNMESGIHDAHVAAALLQIATNLMGADMKRFEVIENKINASGNINASYPSGFTRDNCVVVSVMVTDAATGTNPIGYLTASSVDDARYVLVRLQSNDIHITNLSTEKSYNYKVVLCKYK
jgi:hypothetical protein